MKIQRIQKHIVYGVISFFCPIVAVIAVSIYQSVVDASFWQSMTPEDNAIGAMMAFGELVQLIGVSIVGCLFGIIFAVASLRLQQRVWSVGSAALVFNGLPFLLLICLWIKGMIVGL